MFSLPIEVIVLTVLLFYRLVSEWPDVVTFTKALSEQIIQSAGPELPACIIRSGFGKVLYCLIKCYIISYTTLFLNFQIIISYVKLIL